MTIAKNRLMTLEEYLNYDDGTDRDSELEDGILIYMASENPLNSTIAMFLALHFAQIGDFSLSFGDWSLYPSRVNQSECAKTRFNGAFRSLGTGYLARRQIATFGNACT